MYIRLLLLSLLFLSPVAWAQYTILGPGYVDVPGTVIEVPNMPRIRDQKHMGICWAVAATALAQKYYCDLQQIGHCANLPPDREISILDLMSWGSIDEEKLKEGLVKNERKIRIGIDLGGGYPTDPLRNSENNFAFKKESCFPLDRFYEKFGATREQLADTMSKLHLFFDTYKVRQGTGEIDYKRAQAIQAQACTGCSAELVAARKLVFEMFPLDNSDTSFASYGPKISWGLTKETLDHFMYEVLFASGCKNIPMPSPTVHRFPGYGQHVSKQELTAKLKNLLIFGIPVGIDSVSHGVIFHVLVISGFKKMCSGKPNDCHELVKAHNSWGEIWQKKANEGWIRWDDLFNALGKDRLGLNPPVGALFWITQRPWGSFDFDFKLNETIPVGSSAAMVPTDTGTGFEFSSWDHTICTVSDQGVVRGIKPGWCRVNVSKGRYGQSYHTKIVER